jgi:uridine kinase
MRRVYRRGRTLRSWRWRASLTPRSYAGAVSTFEELTEAIARCRASSSRVVVGISGFGGSGKSTLARRLVEAVPRAARLRGDDFLMPARARERSVDWAVIERMRLRRTVLEPFRSGHPGRFRRYDWTSGELGPEEPIPNVDVLLVDAVGLFHPELDGVIDLRVWVDVDLATATARGKARDHRGGDDNVRVWDEVWVPNERDFENRYRPREAADLRYLPAR